VRRAAKGQRYAIVNRSLLLLIRSICRSLLTLVRTDKGSLHWPERQPYFNFPPLLDFTSPAHNMRLHQGLWSLQVPYTYVFSLCVCVCVCVCVCLCVCLSVSESVCVSECVTQAQTDTHTHTHTHTHTYTHIHTHTLNPVVAAGGGFFVRLAQLQWRHSSACLAVASSPRRVCRVL
jgi:hypothetical protein